MASQQSASDRKPQGGPQKDPNEPRIRRILRLGEGDTVTCLADRTGLHFHWFLSCRLIVYAIKRGEETIYLSLCPRCGATSRTQKPQPKKKAK